MMDGKGEEAPLTGLRDS